METKFYNECQAGLRMVPAENQAMLEEFVTRYKSSSSRMSALQDLLHHHPDLLSGDHYLRSMSENGVDFYFPDASGTLYTKVIAWSRILDDKEILCAVNPDQNESASIYITIDKNMHPAEGRIYCIHGTNDCPKEVNVEVRNGKSVRLFIPAGELVCYRG